MENPGVAELIRQSEQLESSPDKLSRIRFEWLAVRVFGMFESVYADVDAGLLDPSLAVAYMNYYGELVQKPGFERFWRDHRSWYFDAFADHVDSEVFAGPTPSGS